ncbi:MAG: Cytochrome c biogenesis protein transmembrane region [Candidatus Gottesmanbacteria bacterium GW2011_GWA1_34_13]|uniref:Cytochrome c biogenesis protein transmembrane region n=1 Tax=Candidatus Gottesmanbacteria bacterium GW2011_GWA1_34_13 TaxID=1618434 RepID=A0A0G0D7D1_9BACT|nr:MAG: Cytochrome c biogenesis protein transmembrane region [Candidatus Gottesmanbacteria bacterium GW2011_GWA1_34_13]
MDSNLLFGVSLTAAFIGGMVALFAPCCITFLFPSYLGTIFKERSRVVFLTLIFALGLGSILVPIALGFRFIVSFFDQFHTTVYLLGALVMFLVGLMTLFDTKLMLPLPRYTMPQKTTVGSTFLLGIFSGITSSCCAPVLFAAITLSTLSPTLLTSLIVSFVYVLGIVFPLFLLSLFYEKITNQYLYNIKKRTEKPLKLLAAGTFIVSSVVIAVMALTGKIQMETSNKYSNESRTFIYNLSGYFRNPIFDILIVVGAIAFIYFALKQARKNTNEKSCH